MAGTQGFEPLKQRKQALIAESTLHRIELRLEVEKLRASTARVEHTLGAALRMGPWLIPLASVAGVIAGRLFRKRKPALAPRNILSSVIRLIPAVLSLWQRFARRKTDEG